jgi:hypothetical protein
MSHDFEFETLFEGVAYISRDLRNLLLVAEFTKMTYY